MMRGNRVAYDPKLTEHTMVINIDRTAGSFTCVVWDGLMSQYTRNPHEAMIGTFRKGNKRIEVFVYGGKMPRETIIGLLTAFVGGKWVKMTLNEVAGGATIPKHTL